MVVYYEGLFPCVLYDTLKSCPSLWRRSTKSPQNSSSARYVDLVLPIKIKVFFYLAPLPVVLIYDIYPNLKKREDGPI